MKKYIVILMFLVAVTLSACEPTVEKPLSCVPGYEEVDGSCEEIIVEEECSDGETLIGNDCVIIDNTDLSGPDYQSQEYAIYEGRDIVTDSCSHLDNVGSWQPVWCDEFNYTGLPNSDLWSYDVGGSGWGNGESQYYTDADIDNAFVNDGFLTIKSIKESFMGKNYTSTRLISKEKGDFLYGKIQVRAQIPGGRGTWPAIWMLPTDWKYGGWPVSGEIDIMEYVGYEADVVHATIHTGAYNHMLGTQVGRSKTLPTIEEEFHVYEIEWEPNIIRYFIDGALFFTVDYDPDSSYGFEPFEAWPFDEDFHLLINTAIGGAWGGANGIDDSIFPVNFLIDYVRVFQKDYSGMDAENPSPVTNMRTVNLTQSDAFVAWDVAEDDVMIKEYKIFLDNELVKTDSHNAYHMVGLTSSTTYEISVIPVDFAGNEGQEVTYSVTTLGPFTTNDRIEAELYEDMFGIDVEATSDTGGGQNVGWLDANDYLEYTIIVPTSGTYTLSSRVASLSGGGSFDLMVDGNYKISQSVSATGGWQSWQTLTSNQFDLDAGTYTFKIHSTGSGYNINYFEFNKIN